MFGSQTLDVGIGLVLVFLLSSVILTAAHEGIEAIFQTRAATLRQSISELMQGDPDALKDLYGHPLVFALYRGDPWKAKHAAPASAPAAPTSGLPAYIPREVFSAALIDLIQTGKSMPPDLLRAYEGLERLTGGDAARLRREVENWYDSAMDRASGWFKKRTQRNLFLLGLASAVLLNINAISIAQFLNANDAQRQLVIGVAQARIDGAAPTGALSEKTGALSEKEAAELHEKLAQIGLPIGWTASTVHWMWPWHYDPKASCLTLFAPLPTILLVLTGWLITALATMLGAPFWFDLLNRMMVIRSTVKPKEKSPDEPSEDGGTPPAAIPAAAAPLAAAGAAPAGPANDRAIDHSQPIYG